MTRVYLSGPMTGIADNNFPAFHHWAAKLRAGATATNGAANV